MATSFFTSSNNHTTRSGLYFSFTLLPVAVNTHLMLPAPHAPSMTRVVTCLQTYSSRGRGRGFVRFFIDTVSALYILSPSSTLDLSLMLLLNQNINEVVLTFFFKVLQIE